MTDCRDVFDLMENFDLPMCQIGVDRSLRCVASLGFDTLQKYKDDAVIDVCSAHSEPKRGVYERRRLDKYRARGYRFRLVGVSHHLADGCARLVGAGAAERSPRRDGACSAQPALTYYGYSRFEYGSCAFAPGAVDSDLTWIYFEWPKKAHFDRVSDLS